MTSEAGHSANGTETCRASGGGAICPEGGGPSGVQGSAPDAGQSPRPERHQAGPPDDGGASHLRRIWRVQLALLPLGAAAWAFGSRASAAFFLAGGALGLSAWLLHCWTVGRMLAPSVRVRWFFGLAGALKVVLIAVILGATIRHFRTEALPFVTGLLLYVAAILAEAARLAVARGGKT